MKVDHVLVLAAGKGTRMGNIGKEVPKLLWPIFEKTLLELQTDFAKRIAPSAQVHVNLYNFKDKILKYISLNQAQFLHVDFLEEEQKIDIGGAVHNLASKLEYKGNLLILNGDQFLMSDPEVILSKVQCLNKAGVVLFSYEVNSDDGYGCLNIENNLLKGIIPNSEQKRNTINQTYTGMSLVNLETLIPKAGASSFFQSVADPSKSRVEVVLMKDFEYWDFGTTKRYINSMNMLMQKQESEMYKFLVDENALHLELVNGRTYNSNSGIELSEFSINEDSVVYNGIKELITPE